MRQAIGDVLPFAVVVMVSPINIMAAILLLFSTRPISAAAAYLGGFTAGVAVVAVVLDVVAERIDWSDGVWPARVAASVRVVLGVALLIAAVRKVLARRTLVEEPKLPGWMDGISAFTPSKAAGTGFTIGALNPKNVAMAIAASLAVGAAALSTVQAVMVAIVYVVLASLGVAAPLVVTLVLGDRSTGVLESWRGWLERNNDVVMAVLYLVFGVVLIGNAISTS